MSDFENSDDERYANESFENESDNEIAEIAEFESETTENSEDDDVLPSVKENTSLFNRGTHRLSATRKTDMIPFASSSDEEDDVIVGQTLAEINTPSMNFEQQLTITSIHSSRTIYPENSYPLKSLEELQENTNEFIDENEEEEFQKIKEMEERYIQQNSAKTPKNKDVNANQNFLPEEEEDEKYLTTDEECEDQEAETEDEPVSEEEHEWVEESASENDLENNENENNDENLDVHSVASKESFMENNFQPTNNSEFEQIERTLDNGSNVNTPLDHANLLQLIQNSLVNLSTNTNDNDMIMTTDMLQAHAMMFNDPAAVLNPQNIAMALVNAIKSSASPNEENDQHSEHNEENDNDNTESEEELCENRNDDLKQDEVVENANNEQNGDESEIVDNDIEEIQNNGQICEHDDDNGDIYYDSQLDYRISSKTPSSFNSDDYLFHANFIKPFYSTGSISTDKLRVKPQPRKSMSFSNERMREIERHNQILLRKILTQKPTYTAKNRGDPTFMQKVTSQASIRPTTAAVNRKKQQRQIDLDNQVLKRKIEAISLRRRPLLS